MSNTFSFPPTARLKTPNEFKQVFNKSKKFHFKEFTVYCHKKQKSPARLGLAVSKKVDKRAVVRNGIKRVVRESFRIHYARLEGWDIVFVARASIKNLGNQEISELLDSVWEKIGLQCAN